MRGDLSSELNKAEPGDLSTGDKMHVRQMLLPGERLVCAYRTDNTYPFGTDWVALTTHKLIAHGAEYIVPSSRLGTRGIGDESGRRMAPVFGIAFVPVDAIDAVLSQNHGGSANSIAVLAGGMRFEFYFNTAEKSTTLMHHIQAERLNVKQLPEAPPRQIPGR